MTPQEKAKELVDKFSNHSFYDQSKNNQCQFIETKESAKQCALIAVDEILAAIQLPPIENKGHALYDSQVDYWRQVHSEIENL